MPLGLAVQDSHLDALRYLLIHGLSLNFSDKRGFITLFVAVHKALSEDVRELLNHCAIVNFVNKKGCTTFFVVAQKDHMEFALELLNHHVTIKGEQTALLTAANNSHLDVLCEIINHRAFVDIANTKSSKLPKVIATNGHVDIIRDFLKTGVFLHSL